jgi:hypothetical protein
MALWAPAFDRRITASVSHCGCIPFRRSYTRDTGVQAEFVVPGFAAAERSLGGRAEFAGYDAGHVFTPEMRARAYAFLRERC